MTSGSTRNKKIKIEGSRRFALNLAQGRLVFVSAVFVLAYMLILARVFDLAVIQGELGRSDQMAEMSIDQNFAAPEKLPRADVVDRNGVLLATALETASLYVDPALVSNPEEIAAGLSKIFPDLSYGQLLQKMQRSGRFVWLKRNLTPSEQYSVLELGSPGLGFQSEYRRIYPHGSLFAHMVGFTDVDGNGLSGVERSFNDYLMDGSSPLQLSLDVRVQHILHREVQNAIDTFSAKGGVGLVMDVGNGEVLAAVSLPDYDPHSPHASASDEAKPLFNRLTSGVYELGSTFKVFSTAALLETFDISMDYKFDAREPLKKGRFTISDYHPEKRKLTVPEVFMFSSNIGSALMGEMVGTDKMKAFYQDLGLFDRPELEISEVASPLIPKPWRDINTLTASYGHGIAISPLQLVVASASIVNGGLRVDPHLILDKNKTETSQISPEVRIVSPETAHRMRQLMRLVVTNGTGTQADVPGYRVGGKTGTAEKPGVGGYDRKKLLSSFLGFFPMEAPRYAVFVMVDEPQGTKKTYGYATGGWVAAPAVGRIVQAMGPLLGVKPEGNKAKSDLGSSLKQYISMKDKSEAGQ